MKKPNAHIYKTEPILWQYTWQRWYGYMENHNHPSSKNIWGLLPRPHPHCSLNLYLYLTYTPVRGSGLIWNNPKSKSDSESGHWLKSWKPIGFNLDERFWRGMEQKTFIDFVYIYINTPYNVSKTNKKYLECCMITYHVNLTPSIKSGIKIDI